jgi:signal transduction histidine kinase
VLVIDDHEDTLASVRALLEREGFRVLTSSSGSGALELLKNHEVDVIIVDYVMPRMNGAQFVREVRAFDPFVQIILQTGFAGDKPAIAMLSELDIQGFHDKTDDPDRLLLWIEAALKTQRLIRQLRDRDRLQGELVANCSHEFRTPLNIIAGYADLLLTGAFGSVTADAADALCSVRESVRTLHDLVVDFLDYAKVDAGAVVSQQEVVGVNQLAAELGRLGTLLVDGTAVSFRVDVTQAPAELVTDGVKLRTILRNLVTNAVKFTTAGSIVLRIVGTPGGIRLEVEDTGIGIRAEDIPLIFEPFRQLDGSSTRTRGGVGLGLALARRLARALGGDLRVDSAPGAGSLFVLELPPTAEPAVWRAVASR